MTSDVSAVIKDKVDRAISQFEHTQRQAWSFQVERYENEEGNVSQRVEQFNPALPDKAKWQLLSIDGNLPSNEQQSTYQSSMSAKNNSITLQLRELIQLASLEVTLETTDAVTASFKVHIDKLGERASQKLTGLLTYDKKDEYISHIDVTNTAPFSPLFTAKIDVFSLSIRFKKQGEAILPLQNSMAMSGTYAFFKTINEVSSDTFSNYVYVGEEH